MFDQVLRQGVVPIVRGRQQRTPPVFGHLVHIGAGRQEQFRRREIAFTGGENQRC
jgi:hypothetical protein